MCVIADFKIYAIPPAFPVGGIIGLIGMVWTVIFIKSPSKTDY